MSLIHVRFRRFSNNINLLFFSIKDVRGSSKMNIVVSFSYYWIGIYPIGGGGPEGRENVILVSPVRSSHNCSHPPTHVRRRYQFSFPRLSLVLYFIRVQIVSPCSAVHCLLANKITTMLVDPAVL